MKKFLSLFSVLTFMLLSLTFITSQAMPDKQNSQESYQSIEPCVLVVTVEAFSPTILGHTANLIDTYIETDFKPISFGDSLDSPNLYLTYFYLPTNHLAGNSTGSQYFAPCLRKTITETLS